MEERIKINAESGERTADGSVRFSSHPAGAPFEGCMEMVHNMLAYGKNKGKIDIVSCGGILCNYRFYNNGDGEKLPTYERLKLIGQRAGKTISAQEGVSLCGIGTEVMALSSRPYADSTVTAHINVVRDGMTYGLILSFNGSTKEVSYEMIQPKESNAENSYEVEFKGCKSLLPEEIKNLRAQIADTMYGQNFEIVLSTEEDRYKITPCDFLYRDLLRGTPNYVKYTFTLDKEGMGETLVLELSNVSEIIKGGEGNEYEENSMCSPRLSGGAFRYKNIATVCRGDMGWFAGSSYDKGHSTRNNVRYDITMGDYVFTELHKESQVKTKTTIKLSELKDKFRDDLKIYDENGKEYKVSKIITIITDFISDHKTGGNSEKNIKETNLAINDNFDNGSLTQNDIDSTIKVLQMVSGMMKVETLIKKVLMPFNNKKREICFDYAE